MKVVDPIQEISKLRRVSKKTQAIFLTGMEDILISHPDLQTKIRKLFLDCINDYTRSLAKDLVGDVEDLVK